MEGQVRKVSILIFKHAVLAMVLLAKEAPVLAQVFRLVHLQKSVEKRLFLLFPRKRGEAGCALVKQRPVGSVFCLALHVPFSLDVVLPLLNFGSCQDVVKLIEPVVGLK